MTEDQIHIEVRETRALSSSDKNEIVWGQPLSSGLAARSPSRLVVRDVPLRRTFAPIADQVKRRKRFAYSFAAISISADCGS